MIGHPLSVGETLEEYTPLQAARALWKRLDQQVKTAAAAEAAAAVAATAAAEAAAEVAAAAEAEAAAKAAKASAIAEATVAAAAAAVADAAAMKKADHIAHAAEVAQATEAHAAAMPAMDHTCEEVMNEALPGEITWADLKNRPEDSPEADEDSESEGGIATAPVVTAATVADEGEDQQSWKDIDDSQGSRASTLKAVHWRESVDETPIDARALWSKTTRRGKHKNCIENKNAKK